MPPDRPKRGPPKPSPTAYTSTNILKSKSPLAHPTADLHAFLLACFTEWPNYTESEKDCLISSLPPAYQTRTTDAAGNLNCPLTIDFVRSDTYIRDGLERFKREVTDGYYDPTWRKNAAVATREREEGKFDEYLQDKVEGDFGEVVAEEKEPESSESDKEWGKDKAKGVGRGKGKSPRGKAKGRPRDSAARGEMQSLSMEIEE